MKGKVGRYSSTFSSLYGFISFFPSMSCASPPATQPHPIPPLLFVSIIHIFLPFIFFLTFVLFLFIVTHVLYFLLLLNLHLFFCLLLLLLSLLLFHNLLPIHIHPIFSLYPHLHPLCLFPLIHYLIFLQQTYAEYKWVEPMVCRQSLEGSVTLPPSGEFKACPPCNPGMHYIPGQGVCCHVKMYTQFSIL